VLALDVARRPEALPLNPMFRDGARSLKLVVDIAWYPREPGPAVTALEHALAHLAPSLRNHQCRGEAAYEAFPADTRPAPDGSWEPALALAHLIEHVMIDAIVFVTGAPRVSGVTGAHRGRKRRFDVIVECPSLPLAHLATAVALHWVHVLTRHGSPDGLGRPVLELARWLYRVHPSPADATDAARRLDADVEGTAARLDWLLDVGFARRVDWTINFSGLVQYVVDDGAGNGRVVPAGT
jgi:hypothetical protein